jgi:hypothetical protein
MASVIKELRVISKNSEKGIPSRTFVEFIRTRVSEDSAREVEDDLRSILQGGEGGGDSQGGVLLRSGVQISSNGRSAFIKASAAEALIARKLHIVTGASADEDKKQLIDDIAHLEEALASSATAGVEVDAILQAALNLNRQIEGSSEGEEKGLGKGLREGEGEGKGKGEEQQPVQEQEQEPSPLLMEGGGGQQKQEHERERELITLFMVKEKVTHLLKVYDKAKDALNKSDELSTLRYVMEQLQQLYVFCCISLSYGSITACLPACLPAFSGTTWHESNQHLIPPSINHQSTHYSHTHYNTCLQVQ